ncbi:hypothetical protein [Tunturiibacter psychrotolerans]|uniref:hypothetical protein n=1 Tax=Tunturiibacter psychrotolerans TaxID=3069686 RepID=UPI003D24BD98
MKDLVEHIRTVHFTLLVVALVLTAALQFEKKRPLERAADDAEAILQLTERWQETVSSIYRQLDIQASEDHLRFPKIPEDGSVLPKPGFYDLAVMNRGKIVDGYRAQLTITEHWIFFNGKHQSPERVSGSVPQWTTLSDFLGFWDDVHNGKSVFLPLILGSDPKDSGYCGKLLPHTRPSSDFVLGNGKLFYLISGPTKHLEIETWAVQPMIDEADGCNFTTVDLFQENVSLAHVFQKLIPHAFQWGNRDSADEFAELISAAKYYEDTPLPHLASALRDRANTDTERIELFQAKLPTSAIPTFGSVVLLCCQFYLLAHLLELRDMAQRDQDEAWPTGYIGLYKNQLVFAFTIITLTILPQVPLLLSIHIDNGIHIWGIFALAVSITLGIFTSLILFAVRKTISKFR